MIRLTLVSVAVVEESNSVVLVLRAPEMARLLVMQVGLLEGRAIAMESEGIKSPRPLTHELTLQVIERLGATIREIRIREFKDQVFFADLVLEQPGRAPLEIDSRPSDAIALALRAGVPVFASAQVMAAAGIEEDGDEDPEDDDDDDKREDPETFVH